MRVTSGSETSDWHRIGKGIITGCTISVILFALAMNMVVKSAEVECRGPLTKSGTVIPTITEQPVKSLGKLFDSSLKDSAAIQKSNKELGPLSSLPERKWLGLPRSLTSAALYGTSNILQLPFSGLTEELMVVCTREALQYRDSRDCKVSSAGIEVRTGRKWKAGKLLESRLRQKALVGTMATGRAGFGYFPKTLVSQAHGKERHHLLQEEVRAGMEEERVSRAVGLRQRGQAVYDALPSPANLHVWAKSETPSCLLCSGRGSLEHLLSCCPKALADGRHHWRHDQVLKAIAESLASAISTSKHHHAPKKVVPFIKAGEKPRVRPQLTTGLLHTASDWQLQVDLGKQLRFPQHIAPTSLHPDMIITSEALRQLIILELTVPWEECIEEANERKCAKYQDLVEECRERGW
ncbi:hypothetical protein N1851_014151 [Merluccius polli]|uniref:Reverse transcriptase n=1 Tax=Merluccius polli TaxID=89951 RepID=A0AA47MTX5_MERPO|nr:hypothetical protein N1851_014151 [Merluccius polli]